MEIDSSPLNKFINQTNLFISDSNTEQDTTDIYMEIRYNFIERSENECLKPSNRMLHLVLAAKMPIVKHFGESKIFSWKVSSKIEMFYKA